MPFTEINTPLLEEAASIDFQLMKNSGVNYRKHSKKELGLYFIKRAVELHGNRYGYSKVTYVNNSTKVILQCDKHGPFEQTPHNHLDGKGCAQCAGNHIPSTEGFIEKARTVHGDKYDYSETHYSGVKEKINIICPNHGRYSIQAGSHLSGAGCAQCAGNYSPTTEEFVEKARNVHGDKYDYSAVHYKSMHEKISILCLTHGQFQATPANHVYQGCGCPKCNGGVSISQEDFLHNAREVHGDRYNYDHSHYRAMHEKIEIVCPVHGPFFQTPNHHVYQGCGCPKCSGYNHDILYLLKCLDTGWYKIGITTNSTKNRISQIGGNIKEIHHVKLEDPRKHESILHKRYAKDREYNLCVKGGNTEFFSLTEEQVREVIEYMNEVPFA